MSCFSIFEIYVLLMPALCANPSAVNPSFLRRARISWPKDMFFMPQVYYEVKKVST